MAWFKNCASKNNSWLVHIHSKTSNNQLLEIEEPSASNIKIVGSKKIVTNINQEYTDNSYLTNQSSGCFTKPYYYYSYNVHHEGYSYQAECGGTYQTRSGHRPNDPDAVEDVCSGCGATAGAYSMAGQTCHRQVTKTVPASDETVSGSGWSWHSGVYRTDYYCGCGKSQGEVVSEG